MPALQKVNLQVAQISRILQPTEDREHLEYVAKSQPTTSYGAVHCVTNVQKNMEMSSEFTPGDHSVTGTRG
jgi:hypothetical protein